MTAPASPRVLVIACGALARELLAIVDLNRLDNVTIECLPAALHNRPSEIPELVRQRIRRARRPGTTHSPPREQHDPTDAELFEQDVTFGREGGAFDEILVGYADCGTGGLLADVCAEEGVEMLAGAHCYQFFATAEGFERLQDHALGSFYLTDFLARNFDRLVWQGLGIDRHPELRELYFGNYTRLVHLRQSADPKATESAIDAAERLGLELHVEETAYGELEPAVVEFTRKVVSR